MHFNIYNVFYSQYSLQHVLAAIEAIFRVIYYKNTPVVSFVTVTA